MVWTVKRSRLFLFRGTTGTITDGDVWEGELNATRVHDSMDAARVTSIGHSTSQLVYDPIAERVVAVGAGENLLWNTEARAGTLARRIPRRRTPAMAETRRVLRRCSPNIVAGLGDLAVPPPASLGLAADFYVLDADSWTRHAPRPVLTPLTNALAVYDSVRRSSSCSADDRRADRRREHVHLGARWSDVEQADRHDHGASRCRGRIRRWRRAHPHVGPHERDNVDRMGGNGESRCRRLRLRRRAGTQRWYTTTCKRACSCLARGR